MVSYDKEDSGFEYKGNAKDTFHQKPSSTGKLERLQDLL